MATRLAILLALLTVPTLFAGQYIFSYHRFADIVLRTDAGKESVLIEYGEKDASLEIIFKSHLLPAAAGVFKTPGGTVFTLTHLHAPIVNDANRRINSGDWQLTISGQGAEFAKLKPRLPKASFGDTPPLVYFGEKEP
jgi:hypothetical protein